MLDIQFIRDNAELVQTSAQNKNRVVDISRILSLDEQRRSIITQVQTLREERNILSDGKGKPSFEIIEKVKALKEKLGALESNLSDVQAELNTEMLKVPNVPLPEVPVGKDESDNKEIKKVGTPTVFSFTPKSHEELVRMHDLVDFEAGSKVAGFRGYFLKGQLAQLQMSLMMFVMGKLVAKGYTPLIAPSLAKGFCFYGNGQFPWGKDEVYSVGEDEYLAGTAEVPVMGMHKDVIFKASDLPRKYVAFSPCFRKEAGSYGKDTKGLYRVHEFWKVEQVILADTSVEKARDLHEELQRNAEEILQDLELPYRVLLMCTGDMGEPQIKKYDTEVWMPSREGYGETMSNSIMGDFQCRRLNVKYIDAEGNKQYCFSLNNTALASPRILIPLLENHQQEDGSIRIPKALQSLTGFEKIG